MAEAVKAEKKETIFVDHTVNVRRVTKVTKGGKRFSFSATVVSGDKNGRVGIGLGSSREVSVAIAKATNKARKNLITVALRGTTIPYPVVGHHGASKVELRPASRGTAVKAGGAVRAVMDAVGIADVLAKSIGSGNRQNVVKATLNAFAKLRTAHHLAKLRNMNIKELVGKEDVAAQ